MELKYKNDLEDVEQPLDQQIKGSQICEHCKGTGWLKRGKNPRKLAYIATAREPSIWWIALTALALGSQAIAAFAEPARAKRLFLR